MSRSGPQHVIEVFLGPRSVPDTIRTHTTMVERYLTDLLDDLGVPGTLRLKFRTSDESQRSDAKILRWMLINGTLCRTHVDGRHSPDTGFHQWIEAIVETAYNNRDLLLSEDALSAIIENVQVSSGDIPRGAACDCARRALALGYAPAKVLSAVELFEDSQQPQDWVEDALSAAFTPEVKVYLSQEQYGLLHGPKSNDRLSELVKMMREGLFWELGLLVGDVEITPDPGLRGPLYRFELNGVRRAPLQGLRENQFLVNDTAERLKLLGITGVPAINPANRSETAIIETEESRDVCESAGLTCWSPTAHLILALSSSIRASAAALLTVTQVEFALSALAVNFPRLIGHTMDAIPARELCRVLRGLLIEKVSIRNLKRILESILDLYVDCGSPSVDMCIDHVRTALSRQICNDVGEKGTIVCALIDFDFEQRLRTAHESPLTMDEEVSFREGVAREIGSASHGRQVLLTDRSIRAAVRKHVAIEFPQLSVLSYQELHPDVNIQPIGCISAAEPSRRRQIDEIDYL